jgi:selenide,water dikinase
MGATPRTALAIAALPKTGPSPDVVRAIFKGGADTLRQAGVALLGGHTVTDPEVKFGYAVTGEVAPDRVLTNAGAQPGDVAILTKSLGTGIITRARRHGHASDDEFRRAVESMTQLNAGAARVAGSLPAGVVRACTDVTGFGLAGHASEVAAASAVTVVIHAKSLPVLPGARRLAADFLPCGGQANSRHFRAFRAESSVDPSLRQICLDPQTSGGLLLAVEPAAVADLIGRLTEHGVSASDVGRVEAGRGSGAPRIPTQLNRTEDPRRRSRLSRHSGSDPLVRLV